MATVATESRSPDTAALPDSPHLIHGHWYRLFVAALIVSIPLFDFSVTEVVAMGRSPHKRALEREDGADRRIVAGALERVGMSSLAGRVFATMSGGEKQRVLVARALAQESRVLVLDEPTNHLDIKAQLELLDLYCDRLYVLHGGRIVAHGAVAEVLTPALMQEVFGVWAHCDLHPVTGVFHLAVRPLDAAWSAASRVRPPASPA